MSPPDERQFEAGAADAGLRLDVWLERCLRPLSRARVQALLKAGLVGAAAPAGRLTAHTRVRPGLRVAVTVPPPVPAAPAPEPIPLSVLYEDGDVIVIDKPAGLVVHPAAGHASGTLVNALLHHCRDLAGVGGERRPGIAHRLDKDTSGALVVAKHDAALRALVDQFKAGRVGKVYLALARGAPRPPSGTLDTLIGRSRGDRKKMSARPARGRRAVTHYRVLEAFEGASLLEVTIATGRTHQIRVHLAHLGCPVLGDRQYGGRAGPGAPPRQMLHAHRLAFAHPRGGRPLAFVAPIPADMQRALDALRRGGRPTGAGRGD